MKPGFAMILTVAAASAAGGQTPSTVPAGSPLGAAPPTGVAAEQTRLDAQRAQAQAASRARANARAMADAFAPPTAPATLDEEPPRVAASTSAFGQAPDPAIAAKSAPSPYGGYYQIRTPWDRR